MYKQYLDHVADTRFRDLQREEIERHRRVLMQDGFLPSRTKFYRRWLAELGSFLIVWGTALQNRYEDMVASQTAGGFKETEANPC